MMSKPAKKFDSVAMMRAARDKLSATIEKMSIEEELEWLASQDIQDPFLKRLRDRSNAPRDNTNKSKAR